MARTFSGTYTTTQNLTVPATDNPATVTSTGLIDVNSAVSAAGIFGSNVSAWTVTNLGTVESVGSLGTGIQLQSGGNVTNGASGSTAGLITGGSQGVNVSFNGTVTNFGTISATGTAGDGVQLGVGGSVSNMGTINATGTAGVGVQFTTGGSIGSNVTSVTNGASGSTAGLITGGSLGVNVSGSAGTVTNFGTINATGAAGVGVQIFDGNVTNGASGSTVGLITGGSQGISLEGSAGTVTNFGTITSTTSGTSGTGVYLQGGLITNAAGASISALRNAVSLGGTTSAAATVSNAGTLTGSVGIKIGPFDTGNNTIVNFGTIIGTSGTAVSLGSGSDRIVIEPGSSLQGAVANFHKGDTFDLPAIPFSGSGTATLGASNVLQVAQGGSTFTINLDPAQNFTGDFFHLTSDGSAGTLVTENQTSSASSSKLGFFAAGKNVNLVLTTDGTGIAAPIAGDFNIEVFTSTAGSLASGYDASAFVQGATMIDGNDIQSGTLGLAEQLLAGSYTVIDQSGNETIQIVGVSGGGSSAIVLGSAGDAIGGSTVAGNTQLIDASGTNALVVAGAMTVTGGAGATTVWGGKGDSIAGAGGALQVTDATLAGGETVAGGSGSLTVFSIGPNFSITGGTGTSFIDDTYGSGGGSTIVGGSGGGKLAGGENTEILAASTDKVTIGSALTYLDASRGSITVQGGNGTVTGAVEGAAGVNTNILGGKGDAITLGAATTLIDARAGSIAVTGGAGIASVEGGTGDIITGGAGALQVTDPTAGGFSSITGGAGNLTVFSIGRSDTITGSTAGTTFVNDAYTGGGGNALGGASLITGGNSTASGAVNPAGGATVGASTWVVGQAGDTIAGGSGNIYVDASKGSQSVTGGSSTTNVTIPSLQTATGGTAIQGGKLDTIVGGSGTLQLYINSNVGAETVNLGASHGAAALRDVDAGAAGATTSVTGFNTATDVIQSRTSVSSTGTFLGTSKSDGSGGTIVTLVDGSTMTLAGVATIGSITFMQ